MELDGLERLNITKVNERIKEALRKKRERIAAERKAKVVPQVVTYQDSGVNNGLAAGAMIGS